MPRKSKPPAIDWDDAFEDVGLNSKLEIIEDDEDLLAQDLPPGIDPKILDEVIETDGINALFLDDGLIEEYSTVKTRKKAQQLLQAGQVQALPFDGTTIKGIVRDGWDYFPAMAFNLDRLTCNCGLSRGDKLCAHIVALQYLWRSNMVLFLPQSPSADYVAALDTSPFGVFFKRITKQPSIEHTIVAMREAAGITTQGQPSAQKPPAREQPAGNSGEARYPTASGYIFAAQPLARTLEAEFNNTQLRELARTLGVKLKGSSKSGYVEQVAEAINARTAQMRTDPALLLSGLPDELAHFVRRLLTARDAEVPVPRTLASALWGQSGSRAPAMPFPAAVELLRKQALLFPTRVYYGGRDVYYQWLPLSTAQGNLPLVDWTSAMPPARSAPQYTAAPLVNFLDTFDGFITALLSTGTEVRASLRQHPQHSRIAWLRDWEHDADEAENLMHSRPGWVPSATSGISVPLLSPLTAEARARLENQTGLSGEQCDFLFSIAAALQLVAAPDPQAMSAQQKGAFKPLSRAWHVDARANAVEEWLALPDAARFMMALGAWLQLTFYIPEAARSAQRAGFRVMRAIGSADLKPADLSADWCALRRFVMRVLRGLPTGEWVSWATMRDQIFAFHPACAWSLSSSDTWWFNSASKNTRLEARNADDWKRSVGVFIETILADSLRWLGMLETAADANGLQAFRITPLRDWVSAVSIASDASEWQALPVAAAPRPRPVEPVLWLSDTQWRLPPAPDRAEFIAFARKIAQPAGEAFCYTFTPASIERALSQGIGLEEVERQFEAFAAPVPDGARALIQSIAERFGRVRVYPALTLLKLADDYALRELLANTSLAEHVVYQISPRAVVIRDEAVDALKREMVARGYTPGEK